MSESRPKASNAPARPRLVGDFEHIHCGDLAKGGFLSPGRRFRIPLSESGPHADFAGTGRETALEVTYRYRTADGTWQPIRTTIKIDMTECPVRGLRFWFLCPACARRTEPLYFAEDCLACRRCSCLSYGSQHSGRRDRAIRKALDIRAKLGDSIHEILGDLPEERPPGMSQRRYERLCAALEDALWQIDLAGARRTDPRISPGD